jgi:polysaccharide deacetylase family sporulation protein PdaB
MIIIGCVITAIVSGAVSLRGTNVFMAKERKLPIYCVDKKDKVVSISFDAAWGNEQTQNLLDILADKGVKSTFFLVGFWAEKYPDSVKAIHAAGHDVGNHSDTHPHLPQLEKDKVTAQIEECNKKIEAACGVRPILFRPPYGDYNNCVVESTNDLKMHCIQWSVDSLDWKDPTPEDMIKRIKSKIKPGSIILMHNGAKNTPEALPKIIDMIKAEGYQIVPISELIYKENYTMDTQGKQICSNTQ